MQKKILFVCGSNQLYSPAAQAILKKIIKQNGLDEHFLIDSAGSGPIAEGEYPGLLIMKRSAEAGYLITHRTRRLTKFDFDAHEYTVVIGGKLFVEVFSQIKNEAHLAKILPLTDLLSKPTTINFDVEDVSEGNVGLIISALEDACYGLWNLIKNELTYA